MSSPLLAGKLIKRYKRFLADVELDTGERVTVHCANSGSMLGLDQTGNQVLLSRSTNPKRKLAYTWELVRVAGSWVLVNTLVPNRLVREALKQNRLAEFSGYDSLKPEPVWAQNCRFDFLLENPTEKCFLEVKSVTLARNRVAQFPDAVTERGRKHLRELEQVRQAGHRAVMLFLVGRSDCDCFAPAADIDPAYSLALEHAHSAGVEVVVYRCALEPPEITIAGRLDFGSRESD